MTVSPTLSQSPAKSPAMPPHHSASESTNSSESPLPNIYKRKEKQQYSSPRQQQHPPPPPYGMPLYYPPYMMYPPYMYPHPAYLQAPHPPPPPAQRDEDQDDVEIIMNDLEAPPARFLGRSSSVSSATVDDTAIISPPGVPAGLRTQLEYYFSRQNLASDVYLGSKMDSELYVPISIVASFNKVKAWTTDYDTIVRALKSIPSVIVDESNTKVKPNISTQRTTIILRDVDSSATKEDISAIFKSSDENVSIKDIKQEVGNMWYITFDNEEDTINMLFQLRGKNFKGKPIAGRIKSEAILRNLQTDKSSPAASITPSRNSPSPSSTPSPNHIPIPLPPYSPYYGPQSYPMMPMMPMGWPPSQLSQPYFQNYYQPGQHDGYYRNANNRKKYNPSPSGSKYPQQQYHQNDKQQQLSQPNQPNHQRKQNNRNQSNNNFKNNRNQQTPRYNSSIEEQAEQTPPIIQLNNRPTNQSNTTDSPNETHRPNRGSTQKAQNRRRKKAADKKNPETSLQPGSFPPLSKSSSASPDGQHATISQASATFSYADMLKAQQTRDK